MPKRQSKLEEYGYAEVVREVDNYHKALQHQKDIQDRTKERFYNSQL